MDFSLTEMRKKEFSNGVVYALKTADGFLIETTDTFLPSYTKNAIGEHQNNLKDTNLGSRNDRWMVGVSTMSGCPVGCKFCATSQMKKYRNLTAAEIIEQVLFVVQKNLEYSPMESFEFKINYTRMGEPFLNLKEVKDAINYIDLVYPGKVHHYISTVGIRGSDFSWIKDNITLQLSLHSLNEDRRHDLIPINRLMSIEELGQIRTKSKLKTTINMTLVDEADFDISVLEKNFDPECFFIKLSPINPNCVSEANNMGNGIIIAENIA